MRVSHKLLFDAARRPLERTSEQLWRLEKRVSSGKQLATISDDPLGAKRILDYRTAIGSIEQYERNMDQAQTWLSFTESILSQMEEPLMRAKEIALAQGSATADRDTREIAASEAKQLFRHVLSLAGSKLGDRAIFSGSRTERVPFTDENDDLEVDDGLRDRGYRGNEGVLSLAINQNEEMAINVHGKALFETSGGATFFDILRALHEALVDNDPEAILKQADRLDEAMEKVRTARAMVGSKMDRLEKAQEKMANLKLDLQDLLSKTEDEDMIQAISELANQQFLYQAALQSSALITRMSLMDFIR